MDPFASLARSVEEAIRQKRIGTPVSLRLVDLSTADHGRVGPHLARAVRAACNWLGAWPSSVGAVGDAATGPITALLGFANGASAVITAGVCGMATPRLDALLIGNTGILSWEPYEGLEAESLADAPDAPPEPRLQALLEAIRKASARGERLAIDAQGRGVSLGTAQLLPALARPANVSSGNTPKPPYGVLLIAGGATHQEDYARALAADPRCRLVGLADEADINPRRKEWNERLAKELNIPVLPDLDAALARDDVRIVSVCAEPERRARLIVKCAAAGKHLYLDKPLAASAAEARQIAEAVARAGVTHHMFSMVHFGMATRARELVRSGRLGEIKAVHVDQLFAKGKAGTAALGQPRKESARPAAFERTDTKRELYNVGVYPVVFLRWLLGKSVKKVAAVTGNYFFAEHQRADMEDFGLMLMEIEGGITASVMAGRTGWRSHPMGGVHRAVIVGSKGVASIDANRPRLDVWADEPPWVAPAPDPLDPMGFWRSTPVRIGLPPKRAWVTPDLDSPAVADARAFLDALEAGRPCEVDALAAAEALEVLLAAYASAAEGRVVALR